MTSYLLLCVLTFRHKCSITPPSCLATLFLPSWWCTAVRVGACLTSVRFQSAELASTPCSLTYIRSWTPISLHTCKRSLRSRQILLHLRTRGYPQDLVSYASYLSSLAALVRPATSSIRSDWDDHREVRMWDWREALPARWWSVEGHRFLWKSWARLSSRIPSWMSPFPIRCQRSTGTGRGLRPSVCWRPTFLFRAAERFDCRSSCTRKACRSWSTCTCWTIITG